MKEFARLVVTDVDGTLTNCSGELEIEAVDAIRRLEKQGVPVSLISGRPLPYIESLAMYLGTSGPMLAENGAVAKLRGEVHRLGDPARARRAVELLHAAGFELHLTEDNRYRLVDVAIYPFLSREEMQSYVLAERLEVAILDSGLSFHVVDWKVSKAAGLRFVLGKLDLDPGDVLAFGGTEIDIPLFELCRGIALSNASRVLKQVAWRVTARGYGRSFAAAVNNLLDRGDVVES